MLLVEGSPVLLGSQVRCQIPGQTGFCFTGHDLIRFALRLNNMEVKLQGHCLLHVHVSESVT